jgi:hypothetical protein
MTVKFLNGTDYANIYGVYDEGVLVGTIEVKIAGCLCGRSYAGVWKPGYTKRMIRAAYIEWKRCGGV